MSIATRINEMSSHIEQAYDELQGLGADLTNVNKNIENISMVLDNIYDSMPQVSGEGTNLTLDDTRVGKIKSTLKGNTSQITYSGKNLANTKVTNWSYLGVSVSYDETTQVLTINGTSTGNAGLNFQNYNFSNINVSNGERINLVVEYISGSATSNDNGRVLLADTNYTMSMTIPLNGINTTKTEYRNISSNLTYNNLQIAYRTGDVYNNLKIKIMVCKGSDISYEPYVGGTALPNPSYPQPVNVISGDNEINITGKNLFDKSKITENKRLDGSGGLINDNSYDTSDFFGVKASTTYSFTTFAGSDCVCEYNHNKEFIKRTMYNAQYKLTTDENTYYVRVAFEKIKLNTYQFEIGDTSTTYEAYTGNTYNINLPVENLFDKSNITWSSDTGIIYNSIYVGVGTYTMSSPNMPFDNSGKNMFILAGNVSSGASSNTNGVDKNTPRTITTTDGYITIANRYNLNSTLNLNHPEDYNWQIEKGTKVNSYTPYGITPIELCKIGNYQDYFYKDSDKWYLNKQIGKVVLDGSEAWTKSSNTNVNRYYIPGTFINTILNVSTIDLISDYFTCITPIQSDSYYNVGLSKLNNTSIMVNFSLSDTSFDTLQKFKTWLSSHNVVVYYVLATTTTIEVEYQPLIDQLNELEKAQSKENQTNISQVNNDLPFIINATTLLKNSD